MDQSSPVNKRPFGLNVIIILQLLIAILVGWGLVSLEYVVAYVEVVVPIPIFYSWAGWLLVVLLLLAVFGLMRLQRWGWTLTMILTGGGLAVTIWQYLQGVHNFLPMAAYLAIVFYLNQREVQAPFLNHGDPGGVP